MVRATSSRAALSLAAVLCIATIATPRAHGAGADWILLVDTSRSIRGEGKGAKNISDEYKRSLKAFVQTLHPGDRLYVHTFDETSTFRRFFQTTDAKSIEALVSELDHPFFFPEGGCTLIGDAIAAAIMQASFLQKAGRMPGIVLFTDGLETCQNLTTKRIADFQTRKYSEKDFPYSFHVVWAGSPLDAQKLLTRFPADLRDRIKIVDPEKSADVVEQALAAAPPSLDTLSRTIDFGRVKRGGHTEESRVRIRATRPARVEFRLAGGMEKGFALKGLTQPIGLAAGDNDVSLSIETYRTTSPGIHDGILEVRGAEGDAGQDGVAPLLRFQVRIVTSRFWFSPVWLWSACAVLALVSLIFLAIARGAERPAQGHVVRPDDKPAPAAAPVSREREKDDRRPTLLAERNELQASLRRLRKEAAELERRCAQLEREIADLERS